MINQSISHYSTDGMVHLLINRKGYEDFDAFIKRCYDYCKQKLDVFDFYSAVFDEVWMEYIRHNKHFSPTVIVVCADYLHNDGGCLGNQIRSNYKDLEDTIENNPQSQFILCNTTFEFRRNFTKPLDNLKFIHLGSDSQWSCVDGYLDINPVVDKNFNSKKHWISFSMNCKDWRLHRPLTGAFLLGLNAEAFGNLRMSGEEFTMHDGWEGYKYYHNFNDRKEINQLAAYDSIMETGLQKLKKWTEFSEHEIFDNFPNRSDINFIQHLEPMYKDSFVEIVNETIFFQRGGILTEKTFQSMFGCNFPIIMSWQGSVACLRDMGYDMFDDVVDHSYDNIEQPLTRLAQALTRNKRLLFDGDYVKQQWIKNSERFLANVELWKKSAQQLPDLCFDEFCNTVDKAVAKL